MTPTERAIMITVIGGVVAAVLGAYAVGKLDEAQVPTVDGARGSQNRGWDYTNTGNVPASNMNPDPWVTNGPGRQETTSSVNGQIFAKRWHRGGQHNSAVNYEQSSAIQTSTKNPFANGTSNTYAPAVLNATRDPTNAATALVLGPGVAPNNGS